MKKNIARQISEIIYKRTSLIVFLATWMRLYFSPEISEIIYRRTSWIVFLATWMRLYFSPEISEIIYRRTSLIVFLATWMRLYFSPGISAIIYRRTSWIVRLPFYIWKPLSRKMHCVDFTSEHTHYLKMVADLIFFYVHAIIGPLIFAAVWKIENKFAIKMGLEDVMYMNIRPKFVCEL